MAFELLVKDEQYLLNHISKYLARDSNDDRHNYGQYPPGDPRAQVSEGWRFPIVDAYSDGVDPVAGAGFNEVTFVYAADPDGLPAQVALVASCANLFDPLPLNRIGDTGYYSLTLKLPKGEQYHYRYRVDGQLLVDPVNPQRITMDNGTQWSRVFTWNCTTPLVLERWERLILERLTDHILPFRTDRGQRFLDYFYDHLDSNRRQNEFRHAYRFDRSVGVVNFIDKLLAKEENHHLVDYRICLELVDQVLRERNPFIEPALMPKEAFIELYQQMLAEGDPNNPVPVAGWDTDRYEHPSYFMRLLRRHTVTGAFSHPKYGGNAAAAGWAYLAERFRDQQSGQTLFDWQRSVEAPLGRDPAYRG